MQKFRLSTANFRTVVGFSLKIVINGLEVGNTFLFISAEIFNFPFHRIHFNCLDPLDFQSKHYLICYVAKVKASTSAHFMADAAIKANDNIFYIQ